MNSKLICISYLLLGLNAIAIAQTGNLKYTLIKGPFGEPFGRIRNITQDNHGYMWFSDEGKKYIYRYDGKSIKSIKHENNKNSLAIGDVRSVYGDPYGPIWIAVGEGLDRYDPATGIFTHYLPDPNNETSIAAGAAEVLRDKKGRLWVGTGKSVDLLDEEKGTFKHFGNDQTDPYSIYHVGVSNLYEDRQGTIWVACGVPWIQKDPNIGGLYRINEDGSVTRFSHNQDDPTSLINNKVRAMYEDSRGVFWVGTGGDGLHTMDRNTGKFTRHNHDDKHPEKLSRPGIKDKQEDKFGHVPEQITFILEDSAKTIWIGSMWNGINRYDPKTDLVTHHSEISGYSDSTSWNAFQSKDGVLWITTNKGGNLFKVEPFYRKFKSLNNLGTVQRIHEENDGTLYLATERDGLVQLDNQFNLVNKFKHERNDPNSLNNETSTIVTFVFNQDDELWCGTPTGLEIFNKTSRQFSRFLLKGQPVSQLVGEPVLRAVKDPPDTYYFTTWQNGFIRVDETNQSVKQFLHDPKDTTSVASNIVIHVIKDVKGDIWVSGSQGVDKYDRKTQKFKHYLKSKHVGFIYEDSRGSIWALSNLGLYLYDRDNDQFNHFFELQSNLYDQHFNGIVEDKNMLWLNSNSSIVRVNPTTKEVLIFSEQYGIAYNSITRPIYKVKDGRILCGQDLGLYFFNPLDYSEKIDPPTILISDFSINGEMILDDNELFSGKSMDDRQELNLSYNQNSLSFHIASADYRAPESTRYYAWMEHKDSTWRELKQNERLDYFNFSSGRYLFKIKAYLNDGTIGDRSLVINISAPWWQTWWAYSSYVGFFIFSVWGASKYRARSLQRQNKLLEEKVELRTEALNNSLNSLKATQSQLIQSEKMASLGELTAGIAHEIQNPLNFVNNFSEVSNELLDEIKDELDKGNMDDVRTIMSDVKENLEKILHHGKRADAIVKGMLQHSRTSTGIKEPTDINVLCDEYLRLSYHGLRAKDKSFNAKFETDFDPDLQKINVVPQDIGRVVLNLITNAFYAVNERSITRRQAQDDNHYEPTVSVSTKMVDGKIEIKVSDNGNGIPDSVKAKIFQPFFTTKPTGQGTGLGLSLSYDIVKAHGGELKVESKVERGATFTIVLPIA